MKKSLLNIYMQKVAEGDESFADRLCSQLADRLIYIPVKEEGDLAHMEKITFGVRQIQEEGKTLVPVFTSERFLTNWCEKNGQNKELISLLGADFCLALGDGNWLLIDPGAESTVKLKPTYVKKIATIDSEDAHDDIAADDDMPIIESETKQYQPAASGNGSSKDAVAAPPAPPKKKSFLDFLRNR